MKKLFCTMILLYTLAAPLNVLAAESIIHGQKCVTTAGTPERLAAASTPVKEVVILGTDTNTNDAYIGNSNAMTSTTGFPLDARQGLTIPINDLYDVWIDVDTNGECVNYIAVQ